MGIREDTNMTILVDEQQDSCEVNIGGQSGFSGGSVLKVSRQNSFLSRQNSLFGRQNSLLPDFNSLPDFTNLLTPNLQKTVFNFDDSFYQDSRMEDSLKDVSAYEIENIPPQCIKQEAMSPGAAQSSDPDFASILAAVTSANTMTTSPVNSPAGSPASLADVKQESLDSESDDGSYEMYPSKNTCEEDTASLWELQTKIGRASRDLNIPKNPWLWTVDDVNRWLFWVLPTYGLTPTFTLDLDGTKLCLASVQDLEQRVRNKQSQAAEIIGIEIDLWKQAFTMETNQQQMAKHLVPQVLFPGSEAHKVYTDLSESRPATSQHSSISVIPTPVSTTTTSSQILHHQQQPTHCLPPNSLNLHMTNMTLNEIHQQMAYEYQQQSRSTLPTVGLVPHIPQISPTSNFIPQVSPTSNFNVQGWDSPSSSESGYSAQSSDYSTEEESRECSPAPPSAMPRGLPHSRNSIKLWQFLRSLLDQPALTCIRWIDREKGIFKIEDSQRVAKLWGQRKNRPAMNYDKLSRSIRQYYKKKIIKKTDNSKRLVYQFCTPYL